MAVHGLPEYFNPRPPRGGRRRTRRPAGRAGNFNPRPPRGGRPYLVGLVGKASSIFQSTPPARGATYIKATVEIPFPISIHAPREGGDCERCGADIVSVRFQSTPPARGATSDGLFVLFSFLISIHAPREGGDQGHRISSTASRCISIHAPREGGDMVRFHSPQPI